MGRDALLLGTDGRFPFGGHTERKPRNVELARSVTATGTDFAASILYGAIMERAVFGEAVGAESVRFEPVMPTCDNQTEWPTGFISPCQRAR